MTPDFLLHLSNTSLALDYRSFADLKQWCCLGEVALDAPDIEASVLALRNLVKRPYIYPTAILIALPSNKIELLTIAQTALTPDDIKAALTTYTNHNISELCFDYFESKTQTVIAYVTLKALDEVKKLGQSFGFEPIHFVGLPGPVWQNNFAIFSETDALFNASNFLLSPYSKSKGQYQPPELTGPPTLDSINLISEKDSSLKKIKRSFNNAKFFVDGKAIKSLIENSFSLIGSGEKNTQLKTSIGDTKDEKSELEKAIDETKKWLGINTEKSWYEELSGTTKSHGYRAFFNFEILTKASRQQLSYILFALIVITFGLSILSVTTIYGRSTVNKWFHSTDLAMSNSTFIDKSNWASKSYYKPNTENSDNQKIKSNNSQEFISSQMEPANITQLVAPVMNYNESGLVNDSLIKKTRILKKPIIKRDIFSALTTDSAPADYTKSAEKSFSLTGVTIVPPASLLPSQLYKQIEVNRAFADKKLIQRHTISLLSFDSVLPHGITEKQDVQTIENELLYFKKFSTPIISPQTGVAINISQPEAGPPLQTLSERRFINYTQNWLNSLAAPKRKDPEWKCLTEALYFEARGEKVVGQFAVAEVILNRVDSPKFPDTVCAVVDQGSRRKHACQFSYRCDGVHENIPKNNNFDRAGRIAEIMVDGASRQLVGGATFYHSTSVRPFWSSEFYETTKIGKHKFYTPIKGNTVVFFRPTLRPLTIQNKTNKSVSLNSSIISKSNRPKTRQNLPELESIPIEENIKPSEFRPPSSISSSYTKLAATIENILDFERLNLVGVSGTTKKRSALVRLLNGEIIKIGIGDNLNGGHVVDISTATLTYLKSGKSIILKLPKS